MQQDQQIRREMEIIFDLSIKQTTLSVTLQDLRNPTITIRIVYLPPFTTLADIKNMTYENIRFYNNGRLLPFDRTLISLGLGSTQKENIIQIEFRSGPPNKSLNNYFFRNVQIHTLNPFYVKDLLATFNKGKGMTNYTYPFLQQMNIYFLENLSHYYQLANTINGRMNLTNISRTQLEELNKRLGLYLSIIEKYASPQEIEDLYPKVITIKSNQDRRALLHALSQARLSGGRSTSRLESLLSTVGSKQFDGLLPQTHDNVGLALHKSGLDPQTNHRLSALFRISNENGLRNFFSREDLDLYDRSDDPRSYLSKPLAASSPRSSSSGIARPRTVEKNASPLSNTRTILSQLARLQPPPELVEVSLGNRGQNTLQRPKSSLEVLQLKDKAPAKDAGKKNRKSNRPKSNKKSLKRRNSNRKRVI